MGATEARGPTASAIVTLCEHTCTCTGRCKCLTGKYLAWTGKPRFNGARGNQRAGGTALSFLESIAPVELKVGDVVELLIRVKRP